MSDLRVTIHQLFLVWITTCVAGHSSNWNYNVSFLFSYNLCEKFIHYSYSILFPEISPFTITMLSGTASCLCAQILSWLGLGNSSAGVTCVSPDQPHLPPLALATGDWRGARLLCRAWGSFYSASGLCFAFGSELRWAHPHKFLEISLRNQEFAVALRPSYFVWPGLVTAGPGPTCTAIAVSGEVSEVTLSSICALFCSLLVSYTLCRGVCGGHGSAGHMLGVTNRLPLSWHYPFISNF